MDPDADPDPAIFPRCQQKTNFLKVFFIQYMYIIFNDLDPDPQHCFFDLSILLLSSFSSILFNCGSVRIRNFWQDPDPIRNRTKHFGSGFESGSETRSEINQKIARVLWFFSFELGLPLPLTRRQLWFTGGGGIPIHCGRGGGGS